LSSGTLAEGGPTRNQLLPSLLLLPFAFVVIPTEAAFWPTRDLLFAFAFGTAGVPPVSWGLLGNRFRVAIRLCDVLCCERVNSNFELE